MSISQNIINIQNDISKARESSPLAAGRVRLMGVSKGQEVNKIEAAIGAGLKIFGENRVQEAEEKWPVIRDANPDIELHLIGPLQTNKVKDAVALFDVIQTLDREKLAAALAEEMGKQKKPLPCFVQVNTGEEPQKAGIAPQQADALIRLAREQYGLLITGLMCVPPVGEPSAPHFALLRDIALSNGLEELSMGMSGDYETAVKMGATLVRIGTGIFGER